MVGRLRRRKQGIEAVGSLLFYHIGQAKHFARPISEPDHILPGKK
jgi:hypothetical protein